MATKDAVATLQIIQYGRMDISSVLYRDSISWILS